MNTSTAPEALTEQRIDTWLWAARFFKTRSLAAQAITGGKILLNDSPCKKAGKNIKPGDRLRVDRYDEVFVLTVRGLQRQRVSASLAQNLYSETEDDRAARLAAAETRRLERAQNPTPFKPDAITRQLLRALRGKPS